MTTLPFVALPGSGVAPDEVLLGHVVGTHGVRGELRVFLHNPDSTLWTSPAPLRLVASDGRRFSVVLRVRPGAGKKILGRLEGLDDCDVAAALRDAQLVLPASALPQPADDEFYVFELLGAAVFVGDDQVGWLESVQETDGPDVLVIDCDGERAFVPCLREFVAEVDAPGKRLVLTEQALGVADDGDEG